jgi:hypothetical protein
MQLEFCTYTRELGDDDAKMQPRFELSVRDLGLPADREIKPRNAWPAVPR